MGLAKAPLRGMPLSLEYLPDFVGASALLFTHRVLHLQEQSVKRDKLQLVGVTAMLIASKYEEMYAPEINDFVYITDSAYSKTEIRRMEIVILKTLQFNLGRPLPLHFLRRNSKAGEVGSGSLGSDHDASPSAKSFDEFANFRHSG